MIVGLFGKTIDNQSKSFIQQIINVIENNDYQLSIYSMYYEIIKNEIQINKPFNIFETISNSLNNKINYLISIGGDGTLLDSIPIIQNSGIPILGINTGRLGFLATISKKNIQDAFYELKNNNFTIEKRTLLNVEPAGYCNHINYALNEITVMKKDLASMISIVAEVNNCYLNTYWADGLIIATPTGSTGYSLSCGGPIITPDSENFIITPIASHNLTVRPIVLPDNIIIKLFVKSRSESFLLGLDSRSYGIPSTTELTISKENFKINFIKLNKQNFFTTLREKLFWGNDIRN